MSVGRWIVSDTLVDGRSFRALTVSWTTSPGNARRSKSTLPCRGCESPGCSSAWRKSWVFPRRSSATTALTSRAASSTRGRTSTGSRSTSSDPVGRSKTPTWRASTAGSVTNASTRTRSWNLSDARSTIEAWRVDYNEQRPHSSLGDRTPNEFAKVLADLRALNQPFGRLGGNDNLPVGVRLTLDQRRRAGQPQFAFPSRTKGAQ